MGRGKYKNRSEAAIANAARKGQATKKRNRAEANKKARGIMMLDPTNPLESAHYKRMVEKNYREVKREKESKLTYDSSIPYSFWR